MKLRSVAISSALLIAILSVTSATAQQPRQGGCLKTALGGIVCSMPSGGIAVNALGQIVCGPGQCTQNALGQIVCSAQPGGYVAANALGQIVCTGGCVQASAQYCQVPR